MRERWACGRSSCVPRSRARYVAARASWRLQDFATVQVEMPKVRDQAREVGDRVAEALALTALGEAALKRDADPAQAQELVDEALAILAEEDDPVARFDALVARANVGAYRGDMQEVVRTWSARMRSRWTRAARTCRRPPRRCSRRHTS